MSELILLSLYRFLVQPLALFSALVLHITPLRYAKVQKIKKGLKLRLDPKGPYHWSRLKKGLQPIWIHCSSGEFEYAKPVITRLKQSHPNKKILVTFFSPSYAKPISEFPAVDMYCVLPWDLPGAMSSFIQHHQPSLVLISRTDLWPEMLYQLKRKNIPTFLFSASRPRLKASHKALRFFYNWLYSYLTKIFCVHHEDTVNLQKLSSACPAITLGDTRYDQVQERLLNSTVTLKSYLPNNDLPTDRIGFIAGSSWPEDEKVLLEAFNSDLTQSYRIQLVPHEVHQEHINSLQKNWAQSEADLNLKVSLYSTADALPQQGVVIVDQVGILAELYTTSDIAFIGGSFKKSVHSVMEPLAAGLLTIVGPYHHNNSEVAEFKSIEIHPNINAVTVVNNSQELRLALQQFAQLSPEERLSIKEKIKHGIQIRTGASERLLEELTPYLD